MEVRLISLLEYRDYSKCSQVGVCQLGVKRCHFYESLSPDINRRWISALNDIKPYNSQIFTELYVSVGNGVSEKMAGDFTEEE